MSRRGKRGDRQRLLYSTKRWQLLRRRILDTAPPCAVCGLILATSVHHILSPFSRAGTTLDESLAYDPANLQAVCEGCHMRIHYERDAARRCYDCGGTLRGGICGICSPEALEIAESEKP